MATVKLTRKKLLLGLIICLLVFVGGTVAWITIKSDADNSTDNIPVGTKVTPIEDVRISAQKYAEDNDVDGGLAYYNQQIEAREDGKEKSELFLSKADFALSNERHGEALDAARSADELHSDLSTTLSLAKIYEAQGNKEEALKYYQKMLDNLGVQGRDGDRWQQKVEELRS